MAAVIVLAIVVGKGRAEPDGENKCGRCQYRKVRSRHCCLHSGRQDADRFHRYDFRPTHGWVIFVLAPATGTKTPANPAFRNGRAGLPKGLSSSVPWSALAGRGSFFRHATPSRRIRAARRGPWEGGG